MTRDPNYWKARRDEVRGGPSRVVKPCGTVAAARRHQRANEPLCPPCDAAWSDHQAAQYLKRKTRATGSPGA